MLHAGRQTVRVVDSRRQSSAPSTPVWPISTCGDTRSLSTGLTAQRCSWACTGSDLTHAQSISTSIRGASRLCAPWPCRDSARPMRPERLTSDSSIPTTQRPARGASMPTTTWWPHSASARLPTTIAISTRRSATGAWPCRSTTYSSTCCPSIRPTPRPAGATLP